MSPAVAALAELSRAYELVPRHEVLYNIGRVEVQLGHPVEAARAYERYLAEGGDAVARAASTGWPSCTSTRPML